MRGYIATPRYYSSLHFSITITLIAHSTYLRLSPIFTCSICDPGIGRCKRQCLQENCTHILSNAFQGTFINAHHHH